MLERKKNVRRCIDNRVWNSVTNRAKNFVGSYFPFSAVLARKSQAKPALPAKV